MLRKHVMSISRLTCSTASLSPFVPPTPYRYPQMSTLRQLINTENHFPPKHFLNLSLHWCMMDKICRSRVNTVEGTGGFKHFSHGLAVYELLTIANTFGYILLVRSLADGLG